MQRATEQTRTGFLLSLWGIVLGYFLLNAVAMYNVSGTAGLDQAEQLILSQYFQPGYSSQPPLYTYIVAALFLLTGPGLAPLLLLKAVLLGLFVGLLIALGREFRFTPRQQLVAVTSIVFIPQFIWESQRTLTHSTLATTIAAATLLQLARTRHTGSILNYAVLGALTGLGLISKYNYAIFIAALVLAVSFTPCYRSVLGNRRILALLIVALLVTAPHIYWLVTNFEIAASSAGKLHLDDGNPVTGLGYAASSALAFLAPLLLFSMILIARPVKDKFAGHAQPEDGRLLINLLTATFIIAAVFVVLSGVQNIKDRWFQPLLFYLPLIPAFFATPTKTRLNWYVGLGVVLAILVSFALVARTALSGIFNKYSHLNVPYPDLIASTAGLATKPAFILAETKLLGGNARLAFPDAVIQVPRYRINYGTVSGDGLVICETPDCSKANFREWISSNHEIDAHLPNPARIAMPYRYAPSKSKPVYYLQVHAPSPAGHE